MAISQKKAWGLSEGWGKSMLNVGKKAWDILSDFESAFRVAGRVAVTQ